MPDGEIMYEKINISVFMDFDGTITKRDTLQFLLDEFGRGDWRRIEARVDRGELDEAQALQMEMDLVDASLGEALRSIENNIELDPYFNDFLDLCRAEGIRATILSGGFKRFIYRILPERMRDGVSILANEIRIEDGRWVVMPLGRWEDCRKCNHCKRTTVLEAARAGDGTVYIGNGNTDICPALVSDTVIAKDRLAAALEEMGSGFHGFDSFIDVKENLLKILGHP
jgi:2-hydroxy-3-keto-5-methylthiopentenyl-1-phosphate phosphatase